MTSPDPRPLTPDPVLDDIMDHQASPTCWCQPVVSHEDPATGDRVYTHHSIEGGGGRPPSRRDAQPVATPPPPDLDAQRAPRAGLHEITLSLRTEPPGRAHGRGEFSKGWEAALDMVDAAIDDESVAAAERAARDGLREAGEGYEVRVWQRHEPSGVVVLKGHPQLGGRYCLTDGGDWPCATVRAALEATEGGRPRTPSPRGQPTPD